MDKYVEGSHELNYHHKQNKTKQNHPHREDSQLAQDNGITHVNNGEQAQASYKHQWPWPTPPLNLPLPFHH